MIDERDAQIDALLNDLDTALSVCPSPSVASRVRARLTGPRRGGVSIPWLVVATAGILASVIGAYVTWPRTAATQVSSFAEGLSTTTPVDLPPAPENRPSVRQIRHAQRSDRTEPVARKTGGDPQPEIIVSSNTRLALAQLQAAIERGPIDSQSLRPAPDAVSAGAVTFVPFVLEVVKADPVAIRIDSQNPLRVPSRFPDLQPVRPGNPRPPGANRS
jgi:hypothetical protein